MPATKALLLILSLWLASGCSASPVRTPEAFSPPYVAPREAPPTAPPEAPSQGCVNDARFIEDLTIPDGEVVRPGSELNKRWMVANAGSCDWGAGYLLVRTDRGEFAAPAQLALYPARAGAEATLGVTFAAPEEEGEYLASWQAQSPEGFLFGDVVFVLFEVQAEPP